MIRKITSLVLAVALAVGIVAASHSDAEARRGIGYGIAAGVIAGTVLGAYAYGSRAYASPYYYSYGPGPACYKGPRQCGWSGRSCWYNRYGEYVCGGGEWRCWRPTICD